MSKEKFQRIGDMSSIKREKIVNACIDNREGIANYLFYLALTVELVLMIVEKSDISFAYESYVFRATFLLTFLSVIIQKHEKKEWFIIVSFLAFTFLCYFLSGKNDLLRVAVFVMAAKNIDLNKTMKYCFYVSAAGFLIIALLSLTGVMGEVVRIDDYGRDIVDEVRYVFGFGHPNSLFSAGYVLFLMWLWIYGRNCSWLYYIPIAGLLAVLVNLTKSRTGMAIAAMTFVLAIFFKLFKKLENFKFPYILETIVSPIFCVVISVFAAGLTEYQYTGKGIFTMDVRYWNIEEKINYRMSNLYYSAENHGGILGNWKLFASHGAESYFDMGWVRLFYWYGIIPTAVIILLILLINYICYKKKDIWTPIIFFSLSVYTILEATFVTQYIGRNFFLIIAGVYIGQLICGKLDSRF